MTIIIFILILAVLILVHEFGHFITAKKSGMKVEEFGIGFPPKLISWGKGETKYSINAIPFGGFVKILGEDREEVKTEEKNRSFAEKSALKRSLVLVAGVTANFILAWLLLAIALIVGVPASTSQIDNQYIENPQLTITSVLSGSPADEVGLLPGDRVLFAERGTETVQDPSARNLTTFIDESRGEEISLLVGREENILLKLEAREGIVGDRFAIGVSLDEIGFAQLPIHKALITGLLISFKLIWAIVVGLIGLIISAFQGAASLNDVTGPVGIVSLVGDSLRLGVASLLSFTALISFHLVVLNLLPIPALDGGRLLFILIEKIKGKKINPKVEAWVNGVGFVLLIILMIVVTFNDILNLF